MALHWTVSHRHRLVLAIARNGIAFDDVDRYLTALVVERALPYRKLFDLSFAPEAMALEDIGRLAERARHFAGDYALGPVAIVTGNDETWRAALRYAEQATARRPLTVFRDIREARQWLDGQPLPFGPSARSHRTAGLQAPSDSSSDPESGPGGPRST